ITATLPPHAAGTFDVTVTTHGGPSALVSADRFTYAAASAPVISAITPTTGTTAGNTSVTITGSGFSGASAVRFGSAPATNFVVNSPTQITAISPSQAAATVDVRVITPSGISTVSTSDRFTYTNAAAPVVTAVSPGSGTTGGGTSVTITGSGFTGATAVKFGTLSALKFLVLSDTSLTATAPAQAPNPPPADLTVTTPTGTSPT